MLDGSTRSRTAVARTHGRRRSGALRPVSLALALSVSPAFAADLTGRVVDSAGAPLPDAVVFVQAPTPASPPGAGRTAVIDQVDKQFVPHLLPIPVGTAVSFPNHDQIHHHVYSFSSAKTFEIPLYKGEQSTPVVFDEPGAVKLGCNIHDWMSGVILVVPTAYFATTDATGAFTLRDVPTGPLTVVAWHESGRTPVDATAQRLASAAPDPLTFTLDTAARRARPAGGGRSYE